MRRTRRLIVLFALFMVAQPMVAATGAAGPTAAAGSSETSAAPGLSQRTIRALRASADGKVFVSTRRSTGVAGFVRVERNGDLLPASTTDASRVKSDDFLAKFGEAFGIRDTSQLKLTSRSTDELGATHLTYEQSYRGVPVFGAVLKVHLDAAKRLTAVNGVYVPDISVGTTASLSASQAVDRAITEVVDHPPTDESGRTAQVRAADLSAESTTLLVYRTGLLRDVRGANQLAYEVVVTNGSSIREFIYVQANAGKIMNRYSGVDSALHRVLYEGSANTAPIWEEGQPFPGTLNQDQQNIVLGSGESYHFFNNAFGRDSYDAAGARMRSVNNDPTINCPNANWNGATTNYCNGVTADDVVAHEWGHAYTQYTHDLIYQWQSGALNEAYSDIWGETVDFLNARGTDAPGGTRAAGGCTSHTLTRPFVMINSPASIAGFCTGGAAAFGPPLDATGPTTANVTLGDDGVGATSDACTALVGFPAGNIALVDRGTCGFTVKVKNAQNAGAIGVLVADNVWGPADPMVGVDPTITIPSVRIPLGIGNTIKGQLGTSVNVTMRINHASPEDNYRWLVGEDATAFGTPGRNAIRDMWNPRCVSDPGRVTDAEYFCATTDGGGVHTNSGVPNHGYALLVDGGTYNGHTIGQIGLVKAAHLYFRAQLTYQTPTTDFADHADALVAACADLVGEPLNGLSTTAAPAPPSGQSLTTADCTQVSEMIAAVEFRVDPAAQCDFQPILRQGEPPVCGTQPAATVYKEDFEDGLTDWTLTNDGVFPGWEALGPFDWAQATTLPGGRSGAAAFAVDPQEGNCDLGAGDVSGVQMMQSPLIELPAASSVTPRLTFDHYVATEAGWDGGNVKISVDGGPFTIVPASAYTFNPYNATLNTAAQGNTNPLQGQPAWTGTDGGSLGGSWGESQINLGTLGVTGGSTIQLRFDFGVDGCTGIDGWYVDDVTVSLCFTESTPPTIEVVGGGNANSDRIGTMNLLVGDAQTPATLLVLSGSSNNTALVPNSGITFGGSGANRTVTITTTSAVGTAVVTVTVTDLEGKTASVPITVKVGGNGANTVTGTAGADLFFGRNGADAISGLGGHDLASGGKGDDAINGGPGDDTMFGGQGNDGLTGGTGADGFHGGQGTDTAADFNAGEGDTMTGIP